MIIGLDIGGTNLRAVSVTAEGEVLAQASLSGGGLVPSEELLAKLVQITKEVSGKRAPTCCGAAVGGKIQADGTMHLGSTNLPNLAGLSLTDTLTRTLGLPIRIDNDARSAMRGEAWLGSARGLPNVLTMTFGTGIGGGLMLNGRIYTGSHDGAGEIGVWRLNPQPASGDWQTVEEIAAPARISQRNPNGLAGLLGEAAADVEAAQDAATVFDLIGRSIANAHLLLDLDAVILFGGVVSIGEPFRAGVESAFRKSCPEAFQHSLSIRLATLGSYAGAIGAAALWLNEEFR